MSAVKEIPEIRYLYMYRVVGGQKQKFRFTLDRTFTIVEESPCREDGTLYNASGEMAPTADTVQNMELKKRGYQTHTTDTTTYIDRVPEREAMIHSFFVPTLPCKFDGCEELRVAYFQERDAIAKKNGGTCPGCQMSKLQRKYKTIIEEQFTSPQNDTPQQKSPRNK